MPLNKYEMYLKADREVELVRRRGVVMDTEAAIGGAFNKEGSVGYLNAALSGEEDG